MWELLSFLLIYPHKAVFLALWCFICYFVWPCTAQLHGTGSSREGFPGEEGKETVIAASCEQLPADVDMGSFISLFPIQIIHVAL